MTKYIQNILSKLNHNKYLDCYFLTTPETRNQALELAKKMRTLRINPVIFMHQENSANFYEDDTVIKFRNFLKPSEIFKNDFDENYPNIVVSFDNQSLFKITKQIVKLTSASLILVDNNDLINPKQKAQLIKMSKLIIYQKITNSNFSKGYTWKKFISETDSVSREDFLLKINLFNEKRISNIRKCNCLMVGATSYLGKEFLTYLQSLGYNISVFDATSIPTKNYKKVIAKGKFQVVLDFNGLKTFPTKNDYETFLHTCDSCGLTHYLLLLPEDPTLAKLLKQTVTQNINPQVKLRTIKFERVYGFLTSYNDATLLDDYDLVTKIIKQENYFLITDYLKFLINEFINLTMNTTIFYNIQSYQFVSLYVIAKLYENLTKEDLRTLFQSETSDIRKCVLSFLIATK